MSNVDRLFKMERDCIDMALQAEDMGLDTICRDLKQVSERIGEILYFGWTGVKE